MASPLLGYNTNVRHHGKLFHIQTEDSGSGHGHIFTHLFADGGRIIASKKTTYKQYIGTDKFPDVVKRLMRESHKAMFIALRDGLFDGDEAAGARAITAMEIRLDDEAPMTSTSAPNLEIEVDVEEPEAEVDVDALERAADARLAQAQALHSPPPRSDTPSSPGRYGPTRPAATVSTTATRTPRSSQSQTGMNRPDPSSESIFGGDLLSEKSLDEVILSYLAEDADEDK